MALKTAYATAIESNAYLLNTKYEDAWDLLDNTIKDNHLLSATYYIDSMYSCSDYETMPDEYGLACSILAAENAVKTIFVGDNPAIVETKVKAGPVESMKKYSGARSISRKQVDPFPMVTAILGDYCSYSGSAPSIVTSSVTR